MRESHPIDEHFRKALSQMAVAPPPAVAEGVFSSIRSNQRTRFLRRRRLAFLLALPMLVGIVVVAPMIWPDPAPKSNVSIAARTPGPGQVEERSPGTLSEDMNPVRAVEETRSERPEAGTPASTRPSNRNGKPNGIGQATTEPRLQLVAGWGSTPESSLPLPHPSAGADPESSHAGTIAEPVNERSSQEGTVHPISLIRHRHEVRTNALRYAAIGANDYYRPGGAWWVGPSIALHSTIYQWRGDHRALVHALNEGARSNPGIGWGLHGGRQWPSGLRLSAGVSVERGRQDFRWVEQRTEVRTETVTNLVTLNAFVVFTAVDTLSTVLVREERLEGADSRISIQVPIELAWHGSWNRWRAGPRLGIAAERSFVRSSSSLVQDASSGALRMESLSDEALGRRYPLTISGSAGLDIGFALHERWLMIATPFFGQRLTSFDKSEEAFAQAQRFGLRFQLCHTL